MFRKWIPLSKAPVSSRQSSLANSAIRSLTMSYRPKPDTVLSLRALTKSELLQSFFLASWDFYTRRANFVVSEKRASGMARFQNIKREGNMLWTDLKNSTIRQKKTNLEKTKERRNFGFVVSDSQSLDSGTSSEGSWLWLVHFVIDRGRSGSDC